GAEKPRGLAPIRIRGVVREPYRVDERCAHDLGVTQHHRVERVDGTGSRRLEDVVAGALPRCGYRDLGSQIPAKDQLVAGHLVVDPGNRLMLVKAFGELRLDFATR